VATSKNNKSLSKAERERLKAYSERQQAHAAQKARRKRDNRMWLSIGIVVVALAIGAQVAFTLIAPYAPHPDPSASPSAPAAAPDPAFAEDRTWVGVLDINGIPLGVSLDGHLAPQAVSSTIDLSVAGFYNQLSCHRLTTSGIFVLQCGDPSGDGTGGPGYTYGPVENAPADDLYAAGTIAMARKGGDVASMGSQFFIVYKDSVIPSDAAGGYTVIGHVTSGLDRLIAEVTDKGVAGGAADGQPAIAVVIGSLTLN